MKNIVFLGPPGSGKGTQAVKLSEELGLPHVNVGDMLRTEVKAQSPLGIEAKGHMDKGELVPDSLVIKMIEKRLGQTDLDKGFLLDGYPRNVEQAKVLEDILGKLKKEVSSVIYLDVPLNQLVERLTGRRNCLDCKKVYHIKFDPSPNGDSCSCGGKLTQRADDKEETVKKRFEVYLEQTEPLVNFYKEKSKLKNVDGIGTLKDVFSRILKAAE